MFGSVGQHYPAGLRHVLHLHARRSLEVEPGVDVVGARQGVEVLVRHRRRRTHGVDRARAGVRAEGILGVVRFLAATFAAT